MLWSALPLTFLKAPSSAAQNPKTCELTSYMQHSRILHAHTISKKPYPTDMSKPSRFLTRDNSYFDPLNSAAASSGIGSSRSFVAGRAAETGPKFAKGVQLVPVTSLPDRLCSIFEFDHFNPVQSKCYPDLFHTNNNIVVAAPTGAGKTGVMEIAICRVLVDPEVNCKIIYVAPTKALCSERCDAWQLRLRSLGVQCGLLTGDSESQDLAILQKSNIIVTTPEKLDSVTRKWKSRPLADLVQLVLIDEVHALSDSRGSVLEAVVSRLRTVCSGVRFVAISATIPNAADIALWLRDSTTLEPATLHTFDDTYRPVPLTKHVLGYKCSGNPFQFDRSLNSRLPEVIEEYSERKPIIIFCATRNLCISTANYIATNCASILGKSSKKIAFRDNDLTRMSQALVAFHHAGLDITDRKLVEASFISGELKALCCTSTLAVGINLPAHTVIIKGTQGWNGTAFEEYTEAEILQMLGRAGRPQFDKTGVGVLMTTLANKERYSRFVGGTQLVESRLHENLLEHLSVEVALSTVTSVDLAVSWLKSTFFYCRVQKNPLHYNLKDSGKFNVAAAMEDFCRESLATLVKVGAAHVTDGEYRPTLAGTAMSKYYISLQTLETFLKAVHPKMAIQELLRSMCEAKEFADLRLKHNEKRYYREMNKLPCVKYPVGSKSFDTTSKIMIICQNELGGAQVPEYDGAAKLSSAHNLDKMLLFKHAPRVLRFMIECISSQQDGVSLLNSLLLYNSVMGRCWPGSPLEMRQLDMIGLAYVRKLASRNVSSIADLEKLGPYDIDHYLGAGMGRGKKILQEIKAIPRVKVGLSLAEHLLNIHTTCPNPTGVWRKKILMTRFVAANEYGDLLDYRVIPASKLDDHHFRIVLKDQDGCKITCHVLIDGIVYPPAVASIIVPGVKDVSREQPISLGTPIKLCLHKCKDKKKCAHVCCKLHLQRESFNEKRDSEKKRRIEELFDTESTIDTPVPKRKLSSTVEKLLSSPEVSDDDFDDELFFQQLKNMESGARVTLRSTPNTSVEDAGPKSQTPEKSLSRLASTGSRKELDEELLELLGSDIEIQ